MKLVLIASLLMLVSCMPTFKKSELQFREAIIQPLGAETPQFTALREGLLEANCINCHEHKGYRLEKNFQKRIRPGQGHKSRKYLSVVEGKMPKGRPALSLEQANMIKDYINSLKTVDRGPYVEFKKVLDRNKCLGCHGMWENEEEIMRVIKRGIPEESALYKVLIDRTMPPASTDPQKPTKYMSEEDMALVRDFIITLKEEEAESPQTTDDGEEEGPPASGVR